MLEKSDYEERRKNEREKESTVAAFGETSSDDGDSVCAEWIVAPLVF